MTRYAFVINLDACRDQRSCMIGCKMKTRSFLGSHFIETFTSTTGDIENPNIYFMPVSCQHCDNPSCVRACDKGVLVKRDDGIVAVGDTSLCEQCEGKPCVKACPYNAIDFDPVDGRIGKCDMCADRVDAGQVPACAAACMNYAIYFGDMDDPDSVVSQTVAAWSVGGYVHQLKPETGNGPAVYYLLSQHEWKDAEGLRSPAWHNAVPAEMLNDGPVEKEHAPRVTAQAPAGETESEPAEPLHV